MNWDLVDELNFKQKANFIFNVSTSSNKFWAKLNNEKSFGEENSFIQKEYERVRKTMEINQKAIKENLFITKIPIHDPIECFQSDELTEFKGLTEEEGLKTRMEQLKMEMSTVKKEENLVTPKFALENENGKSKFDNDIYNMLY